MIVDVFVVGFVFLGIVSFYFWTGVALFGGGWNDVFGMCACVDGFVCILGGRCLY